MRRLMLAFVMWIAPATCAAPSVSQGIKKAGGPPNILLIITDQQRWDTLGYTGNSPCRTPNLDRLAREGVAFNRCLVSGPLCSPSRAALFTGRYPYAAGMTSNTPPCPPLSRPTLLEAFRDAGYDIAYSGKWHLGRGRGAEAIGDYEGERDVFARWMKDHHFKDTWPYGTEEFVYHRPEEKDWKAKKQFISSPRTAPQEGSTDQTYDAWVAARALERLEQCRRDRPFFHVCSFWGPHPIFVIPEPYYSLYDPAQAPEPINFRDPMEGKPLFQTRSIWAGAAQAHGTSWEQWRRSAAVYWGYVTWLDELIGRLMGRLESLGLAENTIVMMTSDHGEQMGSHGIFQKCHMYEESLRVPLLIRAPKLIPPGRRIDAPVSNSDLAPTLLRLCGLFEPGVKLLEPQGRDLSDWLTTSAIVPAENRSASFDPAAGAVFSAYTPEAEFEGMTEIRSVIGPRYKYVWNRHDRDELYDAATDPGELRNRASDPALGDVRKAMRAHLVAWMRRSEDPLAQEVEAEDAGKKRR
jgi:arylsulfatase A-like enzyme